MYLVSSYNSDWIIGRPIIYFVIDVFSRMITGMYIGLEGPSWLGAMMTLENTAKNKKIILQTIRYSYFFCPMGLLTFTRNDSS